MYQVDIAAAARANDAFRRVLHTTGHVQLVVMTLQPGEDTSFLLNSLIVVIIGGMGSLGGAAIGALALGLVDAYADVYLVFGDTDLTNYSILLTFALLVGVLAVRPLGLFGRPA